MYKKNKQVKRKQRDDLVIPGKINDCVEPSHVRDTSSAHAGQEQFHIYHLLLIFRTMTNYVNERMTRKHKCVHSNCMFPHLFLNCLKMQYFLFYEE